MIMAVILIFGAAAVLTLQLIQTSQKSVKRNVNLAQFCKDNTANEFNCQKSFYQLQFLNGGVPRAFSSLKTEYQSRDSVKTNCHQLVHVIGRAAGEKYGDVSKAYAAGDTFCWSGYYHGVMEAILKRYGDDVRSELSTICSGVAQEGKYQFRHYNCAHGLGHGVMLIEGNELFVSLATCDNLSDSWERQSCYGGVYMENVMAEVNPDHNTKYLKADEPMYPCTAVGEQYKEQCYLMQTSHALKLVNYDFSKVFEECEGVEGAFKDTCLQSLGRDASGNSNNTVKTTHDTCMLGKTTEARENCVIGAVKDFVSHYHGIKESTQLCDTFEPSLAAVCHKTKQDYVASF